MPGVPSGRGCDACRVQKKKCEQREPRCARCARLNIECVGQGKKRYKFIAGNEWLKDVERSGSHIARRISTSPRSEVDVLVSSLIGTIDSSVDIRYNLAWSWPFLEYLPQRLGRNEALDAATSTLVVVHTDYCTQRKMTPQALVRYSKALSKLKDCLDNATVARSSETLCAVMVLLVCQAFMGNSGNRWTGHGEGAATLLKARGYCDVAEGDDFERSLLMSLSASVLFEGVFNPNIRFSPSEWQSLILRHFGTDSNVSTMMLCLATVPSHIDRGRKAPCHDSNLLSEARCNYRTMQVATTTSRSNLDSITALLESKPARSSPIVRAHAHLLRAHSIKLGVTIYLGRILHALDLTTSTDLCSELDHLAKEMIRLAQDAKVYAPLGSAFVVMSYWMAWMGLQTGEGRAAVESSLLEYYGQTDDIIQVLEGKVDELTSLRQYRSHLLLEIGISTDRSYDNTQVQELLGV